MHYDDRRQFMLLLTDAQARLFAYVLSLLPDREAARDVLQETNLLLWEKAGQFHPTDDTAAADEFGRWACKIAHFKVLSHFRDRGRDRHLFDESMLNQMAGEAESHSDHTRRRLDALATCMQQLPDEQRSLIRQRYAQDTSVTQMAGESGRSPVAVRQALFRIRCALMRCIERRMGQEAGS